MRAALTAEERTRRGKVYQALVEKGIETRADLEVRFDKCQSLMVAALFRSGVASTLSANWLSWRLEWDVWAILVKDGTAFPFEDQKPAMYGPPYSEIYLAYVQTRLPTGDVPTLKREVPSGVERHPDVLLAMWQKAFPGRPFEDDCDRPFVVRFRCDDGYVFFHQCIARDEDEFEEVVAEAAFVLGGQEVVLIVEMYEKGEVYIALDFDEKAKMDDIGVQTRFRDAWCRLKDLNVQWLLGENVHIVQGLRNMLTSQFRGKHFSGVTATEKALREYRKRAGARLREANELRPDDPERAFKLLEVQIKHVRGVAQKKAAELQKTEVDILNAKEVFTQVNNFVSDPRFQCLTMVERMGLVENVSASLAEAKISLLIDSTTKDQTGNALASFVLFAGWDNIMSRPDRLEACKNRLAQSGLSLERVEAWVETTRARLYAGEK
ncbi:hypothetical protein F5Y13DRAFT_191259 [Hypoxylon sp. FL1857]|nr:hypothetical protein F5Y13DRAFT_191259 [Hypoxylon sp. FL1857]